MGALGRLLLSLLLLSWGGSLFQVNFITSGRVLFLLSFWTRLLCLAIYAPRGPQLESESISGSSKVAMI